MWVYKGGWRVQLAWPEFLTDLEQREGSEASVDLECRGAFVRFRSRLVQVDRPKACNADAARRFGVVPQQVGLLFANGVRIIIHMRHVEGIVHEDGGVIVRFCGDGCGRSSIALYPADRQAWVAG